MALFCSKTPISSLSIPPHSTYPNKQLSFGTINLEKIKSNFSGKSISSTPSFLNPIIGLHCCSISSSSTENNESSSKIIFIKGLPQSTSEGSLKKAFSQFGEISIVKVVLGKKTKQPVGFAFMWFTTEEAAQMAVKEMNGKFFDGRFVMVTIAQPGSCKPRVKATPYKF